MSAKKTAGIQYKCSSCGHIQPRWMGRCPECGEWNSFAEYRQQQPASVPGLGIKTAERQTPKPLSSVTSMKTSRLKTGIAEFDLVLGGGAMKRSAVLIGGEPGIGKSTLLLQTAAAAAAHGAQILYVSGEESAAQIRARAERLCLKTDMIQVLCTAALSDIEHALDTMQPQLVIIDSIQTVYAPEAGAVPGTVNQLKYNAASLVSWVKEHDSVLFLTAHITKDGVIAGPKSLEHMVDTVISFDRNNENARFLRAHKNRFGSVDELGIFTMEETGLVPVPDPSGLFMTNRNGDIPTGIALAPVFEGSRVFLVEIQALTVPAKAGVTRVYSDRIDSARVSRIAAVIEKCAGLRFSDQDLYIHIAGGVRLSESAVDAAIAAALCSSRTDTPLPRGAAFVGELSLAGEIRPVARIRQRAKAARALGIQTLYAPEREEGVHYIDSIRALVQAIFSTPETTRAPERR